ncbi:MAG TPA: hypothetical protein VLK36_06850 [Gaiellaceae bacterium]|nr:hypothetical protein [Gaiellaceae bacterium]
MRVAPLRLALLFACACLAAGVGADGLEAGSSVRSPRPRAPLRHGLDANGGFVVGGRPTFLIALSNPPPLSGRTPAGRSGPVEIVRAGVNLVRVGPSWTGWTRRELEQVLAWDRTAARLGVHTWVRLNTFAATQPRWRGDAHLAAIVHALTRSRFAAGIGLWQGADEPWSRGIAARSLAFFYCRLSSRGDPRACVDEPTLDRHHPLVTILAPSGHRASLAPYSGVTDSLGVDVYPIALDNTDLDLHMVGVWTRTIARITRDHSVWTTLQICSRHAYNEQTGAYVVPSAYQERYMVYDAIINGARGISFFGGGNPRCWNRTDRRYGWNWTVWNKALDRLIEQIGPHSALGPALDNVASNDVLRTSDPGTEVISRVAITPKRQLFVIAARSNADARRVTISGLPASVKSAVVYGEGRTVPVSDGNLRDSFRQWQVHVYRVQLTTPRA